MTGAPDGNAGQLRTWVQVGIACGLLATIVYPLIITVSMPLALTVILAAAFGPLLSVASLGLYRYMAAHSRTVSLGIAVVFNVIAGTLVNTMLVVQMSVSEFYMSALSGATGEEARELVRSGYSAVDSVQLGLDVSWDIYIAVGTVLFAINMIRHPRFGRLLGGAGVLIGVLLLVLNLASFPVPPADGGSLDLGPLLGLWYFVTALVMVRALRRDPILRSGA